MLTVERAEGAATGFPCFVYICTTGVLPPQDTVELRGVLSTACVQHTAILQAAGIQTTATPSQHTLKSCYHP